MKTLRPLSSVLTTPKPLQPSFTTGRASAISPSTQTPRQRNHRTFVSSPFNSRQTLTASRTLQYPSKLIYSVISDVDSYSTFLPYCQESVVTKYSQPAPDGKKYPEEARLLIGFNDTVSEAFTSRVYCIPGQAVEAVSGQTETSLPPDAIKHHSPRPSAENDPSRKSTVLQHLLTRWSLRPYPYKPPPASAVHPESTHKNHEETSEVPALEKTEVNLNIEFQFANPLYAALSSAAAPMIADKMIEAFEKRVKSIAEGPASVHEGVRGGEGVRRMKV